MKMQNRLSRLWPFVFLPGWVLLIGRVELRADEVQGPVLLVVVWAFILGLAKPKWAWLWAVVIGGSIFAAHAWARAVGYPEPYPPEPNIFAALIALIPAFIGAYAGAGLRWGLACLPKLGSGA